MGSVVVSIAAGVEGQWVLPNSLATMGSYCCRQAVEFAESAWCPAHLGGAALPDLLSVPP